MFHQTNELMQLIILYEYEIQSIISGKLYLFSTLVSKFIIDDDISINDITPFTRIITVSL